LLDRPSTTWATPLAGAQFCMLSLRCLNPSLFFFFFNVDVYATDCTFAIIIIPKSKLLLLSNIL
jgi:hypothetical protein